MDRDEFSHKRWGRWGWGCTCKVSAMHSARHFQSNSGMRYKGVFLESESSSRIIIRLQYQCKQKKVFNSALTPEVNPLDSVQIKKANIAYRTQSIRTIKSVGPITYIQSIALLVIHAFPSFLFITVYTNFIAFLEIPP